jgi:hypothetical protein
LEDVDPEGAEKLLDALGMGNSVIEGAMCKVWTKSKGSVLSHSLYLTEDLFQHHVLDGYRYPGLCLADQVVFRCRLVEETSFCEELQQFWADWVSFYVFLSNSNVVSDKFQNDVAISVNPEDNGVYLLETFPGIKARALREECSDRPLSYFKLKWRYRDSLAEQQQMLKEVLGRHYDPSYRDFLMFLRSEEFDFTQPQYIGEGSFGRVYCVPWESKSSDDFSLDKVYTKNVAVKIPRIRQDYGSPGMKTFVQKVSPGLHFVMR